MRFPRLTLSLVLASGLILAGCSDVDSTHLKTAGIRASLGVTGSGTGNAVASAEFQVDGSALTYVELQAGDTVTASQGDQTHTLVKSELLGLIAYYATFEGADAEGTSFKISLQRDADTSAPDSTVTLPAQFNITAPTGTALSYSRANDDLVVTYDNAGKSDAMSYSLRGTCISPVDQPLDGDPGTFTLAKATLAPPQGSTETTCTVTLTLSRTRTGTLDSAYASGSAWASQTRTFDFTSTP